MQNNARNGELDQNIIFRPAFWVHSTQTLVKIYNNPTTLIFVTSLRDRVVLYINCQEVGERPIDVVDSRIDLSGEILVAKEADNGRTTAIDLQWMVMSCDPESVERETCDELPVSPDLWIYANPAFWGSIPDTASMLLGQESNPGGYG